MNFDLQDSKPLRDVHVEIYTNESFQSYTYVLLQLRSSASSDFIVTTGLLSMLHESRNDLAMLIGSLFVWIMGGGYWSIDRMLQKNNN